MPLTAPMVPPANFMTLKSKNFVQGAELHFARNPSRRGQSYWHTTARRSWSAWMIVAVLAGGVRNENTPCSKSLLSVAGLGFGEEVVIFRRAGGIAELLGNFFGGAHGTEKKTARIGRFAADNPLIVGLGRDSLRFRKPSPS